MTTAQSASPEIVPFRDEHLPSLLRLWERYFGPWSAERLQARWSWQFTSNPFATRREPLINVAISAGEVVGHIAGIPIPMRLGGRSTVVLAASGLVADEAHRWVGFRLVRGLLAQPPVLATAMSEKASELFLKCGTRPIPTSRRRLVLPRRYGGALGAALSRRLPPALSAAVPPPLLHLAGRWYLPPGRPRRRPLPKRRSELAIRSIARFGPDYDALWARAGAPFASTIERTADYLNWRYLDFPDLRPICLGAYDNAGGLQAAAVLMIRAEPNRHKLPGARYAEIVEFIADDHASPAAESLITAALHAADRRRIDAVTATGLPDAAHDTLKRLGFLASESDQFAGAIHAPEHEPGAGTGPWLYTSGDGDSLFSVGV